MRHTDECDPGSAAFAVFAFVLLSLWLFRLRSIADVFHHTHDWLGEYGDKGLVL